MNVLNYSLLNAPIINIFHCIKKNALFLKGLLTGRKERDVKETGSKIDNIKVRFFRERIGQGRRTSEWGCTRQGHLS
jgi:hypothetical protein